MRRKKFIATTGLLAGGLFVAPVKELFARNTSSVLRVGIIGCGDRGKGLLSVMQAMEDKFEIKAICDVLAFRRQEAIALLKSNATNVYTNYRQVLDNKNIDVVVIATPLHTHYKIAADALKTGRHIYLEKTMTYSIAEAIDLVKLSKRYSKQVLQVGHQYRYTPLYFKVKEMINKGYLGTVTQIDCRWDRNTDWRRPVPAGCADEQINWRMYRKYSGGLPAELLSHQMDFINWAFDTHPDEVMGTGGIDYYKDGRETYDNVQIILRYNQKGMIGNFGTTCGNAKEGFVFKIKGTKGMVSLLHDDGFFYPEPTTRKELEIVDGVTGATKIEWNKDGGVQIIKEKIQEGTWYALQDLYNSISEKKQPVSNAITGATTAVCVHLANEAIFNHKILNWKSEYNFQLFSI